MLTQKKIDVHTVILCYSIRFFSDFFLTNHITFQTWVKQFESRRSERKVWMGESFTPGPGRGGYWCRQCIVNSNNIRNFIYFKHTLIFPTQIDLAHFGLIWLTWVMSHDSFTRVLTHVSHDSWLIYESSDSRESWLMTHSHESWLRWVMTHDSWVIWVKSIWVDLPTQNTWGPNLAYISWPNSVKNQ